VRETAVCQAIAREGPMQLLYVSRPSITPAELPHVLDEIRSQSLARNTQLGITGLLIATPEYFAQVLEGAHANVEQVMASIARDSRHSDVRIIHRSIPHIRRYTTWRLTRFGEDQFGRDNIVPVLASAHEGHAASDVALIRLFDMIARAPEPASIIAD